MQTADALSPLVDAAWLDAHASDPSLRIVDVRWYLGRPGDGRKAYERGHIPGAVFLDLERDLASPPGSGPGRHPLPAPDAFARSLASIGVTPATTLVAYDDMGGAIAARLWWLLRYFGLPIARVLNGGLQAWTARALPLSTDLPSIAEAPLLSLTPAPSMVVDKADVDRLRRTSALILDARARPRYEGQEEPIDARPGHIPGARSAPFMDNLIAPAAEMRSPDDLKNRYAVLGAFTAPTVVCSCGSGVTACHTLFALAIAGRDDALLYEGSWSDWSADPTLPAAVGPTP